MARIQSAGASDVGQVRRENQDAFGEFSTERGERLFVVADGMGGHRGGSTASRLCVETIGHAFAGPGSAEARLQRGFALANAHIHEVAEADPELIGMGTTAVAVALTSDGSAALAWVGDSRVYRFHGGALEQISVDHSIVGEMVRAGALTPEAAEAHARRNELTRALGPMPTVEVETRLLDEAAGDRFLLCTDGLWGSVPAAELTAVLADPSVDAAVKTLIARANERGGPDNVTAVLVSVEGGERPGGASVLLSRGQLAVAAVLVAAVVAALLAFFA